MAIAEKKPMNMTDRMRELTPFLPAKIAEQLVARMTPEKRKIFRDTLIATARLDEHITDVDQIDAINKASIAEGLAVALTAKTA